MTWRLLDVCSGQGIGAVGYHRAGFEVHGVDIEPQPRYPYTFTQGDGLALLADKGFMAQFDAVHASWPCQRYTKGTTRTNTHPDLIGPGRLALQATGLPWVMENVPSRRHDLRPDLVVCGCHVGLPNLVRQRWFETSWRAFDMLPPCQHGDTITVLSHGGRRETNRQVDGRRVHTSYYVTTTESATAMGVDWPVTARGLGEAIPPAYTHYIGTQLRAHLETP